MIEIIAYENTYQPDFYRLNAAWLDKYGLKECHDIAILDDPQGMIIDNGGFIWLAKEADMIVGSAALIKENDKIFELAKLAVADGYKGRGISKLLMDTCIAKAKEQGAIKLELFSNHQLTIAMALYRKYGFCHTSVNGSPYLTADIKMEMTL